MENVNAELLSGIYKLSKTGIEAINTVLPKVENTALREELTEQYNDYKKASDESERVLMSFGETPKDINAFAKAMMWGSVQLHTLADSKPDKIAEIMINGTTKGIIDLTKHMTTCSDALPENLAYADSFIKNEQRHIDNLKAFL